ncbi:helix-turn-helix domain-containing protein, partial [Mesorhizobium sp.]
EDLFYRLNVYPIFVPPLRDRRDDIPYLVRHFMEKVAPADPRHRPQGISARALAMLQAYDWPGNIRQLENAVFRASVLAESELLTEEEFPQIRAQLEGTVKLDVEFAAPAPELNGDDDVAGEPGVVVAEPDPPARLQPRFGTLRALDERGNVRALAEVELEMIKLAIDHYNGQMSEVARRLGIGRSTLYRKLKEYGIDPESGRIERLAS